MVELRGQVKRKLVILDVSAAVPTGARVVSPEGIDIGDVRSVGETTHGFRALALVKLAFTTDGASVEVRGTDTSTPARVAKICGRA